MYSILCYHRHKDEFAENCFDWIIPDIYFLYTSAALLSWPKLLIWILVLERSEEVQNNLFKLFMMILLQSFIFFRLRGYIWHWAKPELSILPTVDDEVDGTVEDYEEVGDSHGHLRFICSSESKVHLSSIIVIIVIVIRGTDNQYFLVFRRTKIFYYKEILRNSRIYLHETAPQSLLGIFIKKL